MTEPFKYDVIGVFGDAKGKACVFRPQATTWVMSVTGEPWGDIWSADGYGLIEPPT